jgi:hypothetical protein
MQTLLNESQAPVSVLILAMKYNGSNPESFGLYCKFLYTYVSIPYEEFTQQLLDIKIIDFYRDLIKFIFSNPDKRETIEFAAKLAVNYWNDN